MRKIKTMIKTERENKVVIRNESGTCIFVNGMMHNPYISPPGKNTQITLSYSEFLNFIDGLVELRDAIRKELNA